MPVRFEGWDAFPSSTALAGPLAQQAAGSSVPVTELAGMLPIHMEIRVQVADVLLPPLVRRTPAVPPARSRRSFADTDRLLGLAASRELPGYRLCGAR